METISAASSTSRKTSSATPSMRLFLYPVPFNPSLHDQHTVAGVLMEIVEELVVALVQRADEDRDLAVGQHDLLAVEFVAFELGWRGILIVHQHLELGVGRYRQLGRLELVVLDDQLVFRNLRRAGCARDQAQGNQSRN